MKYLLTTSDNPYSPLTNFNKWLNWDELNGYQTCELLARVIDQLRILYPDYSEYELEKLAQMQIVELSDRSYKVIKED